MLFLHASGFWIRATVAISILKYFEVGLAIGGDLLILILSRLIKICVLNFVWNSKSTKIVFSILFAAVDRYKSMS